MSYSQNDEEQFILDACQGIAKGRVLDIGAWDAKHFSNSRHLIELGWSAVLIEPSPKPVDNLLREYGDTSNIKIVAAAVGLEHGWADMRITEDGVSSSVASVVSTWAERGGYYGTLIVPQITWADIHNRFGGFDAVNIDAEGLSSHLFIALMETGAEPRCICVEHDGRLIELGQAASRRGYSQTYVSQENAVFVKRS